MSFKSLKEFGVSAERLGSICKRWMARVQRSVCSVTFVRPEFCQQEFKNLQYPEGFVSYMQFKAILDHFPFWSRFRCYFIAYFESCFTSKKIVDGFNFTSSWYLVPTLVSVNVCVLDYVCDRDRGAVVLCTLVGIDYLSPRGSPERKMARFSISLISIIVLLH